MQTKASADGFDDKDALGLFAVNYTGDNTAAGTLKNSGNQADNVKYIFDKSSVKWSPVTEVYYKDIETNVDLYLYYPYQSNITDVTAAGFEVQHDQSTTATSTTLSGYEASDFLWGKATNVAPSSAKVTVQMKHKMSAVSVTLAENGGFAKGEFASLEKKVTLTNVARTAKINYATGEVTASGTADAEGTVMNPQADGTFRAVAVPQTIEAGTQLLSIVINDKTYTFKNSASATTFQPGKLTKVTVKIKKVNVAGDYGLSLGIGDWEDGGSIGGDAEQDW